MCPPISRAVAARSRPIVGADLRNCTGKTQGHLFRVGETFLMQLHRSRPEPRLSTFERCWLGGATGLAQRTGDTRDLFALRSPGSVRRAERAELLAKPVNGINAPQRPDCVAEVVGFELRNVVVNYPFERSHRFAESSRILATETIRV